MIKLIALRAFKYLPGKWMAKDEVFESSCTDCIKQMIKDGKAKLYVDQPQPEREIEVVEDTAPQIVEEETPIVNE